MARTRLPSDSTMRAWQLAGRLICQCIAPLPHRLPMFGAIECHRCWRPILHGDVVGLIASVLDEIDEQ